MPTVPPLAWSSAASGDYASPPPVQEFAGAFLEEAGTATAWGDPTSGPIGIACALGLAASGVPNRVVLRGTFTLGP